MAWSHQFALCNYAQIGFHLSTISMEIARSMKRFCEFYDSMKPGIINSDYYVMHLAMVRRTRIIEITDFSFLIIVHLPLVL